MGAGTEYIKSLFIGFVFTPVFFVVINAIGYELQKFLLFRGMPIAIHQIAMWLLLIPEESRQTIGIIGTTLAWVMGWLLAWSRSRNTIMTILAIPTSFFLYIMYLVAFWRIPVVIYLPEGIIPVSFSSIAVCVFAVINKYRPRKTIFDLLERAGKVFPDAWKKPYNLPIRCPRCGAILHSSPKYCWNCYSDIEEDLGVMFHEYEYRP
mgnify:CR=1 FL=1